MRKILVLSAIILTGISLQSCSPSDRVSDALDYHEDNVEQEYKTTYHIELNDGRTFEGVSNDEYNGHIYHDYGNGEYVIPVSVISSAEDMTFLVGLIIAGGELLPLGSETTENSAESVMGVTIVGEGTYVSRAPFIGTHIISNLQIHDYALGMKKATFRYDFNDVVLRQSMESEGLTASGYIKCEVR